MFLTWTKFVNLKNLKFIDSSFAWNFYFLHQNFFPLQTIFQESQNFFWSLPVSFIFPTRESFRNLSIFSSESFKKEKNITRKNIFYLLFLEDFLTLKQYLCDCWSSCCSFTINSEVHVFSHHWINLAHISRLCLMRTNCILCLKLAVKSRGHFAWERRVIVRKELPHFVEWKYLCIKIYEMKKKKFSS